MVNFNAKVSETGYLTLSDAETFHFKPEGVMEWPNGSYNDGILELSFNTGTPGGEPCTVKPVGGEPVPYYDTQSGVWDGTDVVLQWFGGSITITGPIDDVRWDINQ